MLTLKTSSQDEVTAKSPGAIMRSMVYEVITPEYERDGHDFTVSSPEISAKKEASSSPLRQAFSADDVETSRKSDVDQPVPPA